MATPNAGAAQPNALKRKVHRSPNYPAISLTEAIARARQIYDAEKRALASTDTLLAHMGYRPLVGPGLRALSALKQYGLVEERAGQYRISDAAFNILNLSETSPDREAAIQDAIRKPALFNLILTNAKDQIPSDINLRDILIRDHKFNPASVATFIKAFRETVELAKPFDLDEDAANDSNDQHGSGMEEQTQQLSRPFAASTGGNTSSGNAISKLPKGMQTIFAVRMKDGTNVELRADAPLSQTPHGGDLKALLDMLLPAEIPQTSIPAEPAARIDTIEERVAAPAGKVASVGFMITHAQKAKLREQGHTEEQIAKMKPDEAHKILGLS
jgi:hypothetical protein